MRKAGRENLSNIVIVRRLTLVRYRPIGIDKPACVAMQWIPNIGKRRGGRESSTWRQTFQEALQIRESAGMVFAEWQ